MIDNLQIHYLQRLDHGLKFALHGEIDAGIDILLELRLMPTLGLYVRALVNLSLYDLTTIERFPDKAKFAEEALRIASELQCDVGPDRDAYLTDAYTRLTDEAAKKAADAAAEAREHMARKPEEKGVQPAISRAIRVDHVVRVPTSQDNGHPTVENMFTLRLNGQPTSRSSSDIAMSDDTLHPLPLIQKKRFGPGGFNVPPPSSQESGYHSMSS